MGSMEDYDASVSTTRTALPQHPEIRDLIRYATLAASGHNTQPWRFRVGEGQIAVLPDLARRTPIVDPDDHHLFASLGCASENLALASGARGHPGTITFDPANGGAVVFLYGPGQLKIQSWSMLSPSASPRAPNMTAGRSVRPTLKRWLLQPQFRASIWS